MGVPDLLWEAAWAERPRLLAIARRRCRNRAEAEEIVSEAILRCVTHPRLDPRRLPALLTALVMRLCVDELRARALLDRNGPRTFTRPDDAEADVLDRAEAQWLSAEMARLADSERAALTARMLGLTVEETAEALGVSYKSAESALGRARRKMRTVWARTLGIVLPWRWRRRGGATAGLVVAAVVVTLTVTAWHPWRRDEPVTVRPPVVPRAQAVNAGAIRTTEPPRLPTPTTRRVRRPEPPPRLIRVVTSDLRLGPLRQEPVVVTLDLTDPVGRVQGCIENGVEVKTTERSVGVVCK